MVSVCLVFESTPHLKENSTIMWLPVKNYIILIFLLEDKIKTSHNCKGPIVYQEQAFSYKHTQKPDPKMTLTSMAFHKISIDSFLLVLFPCFFICNPADDREEFRSTMASLKLNAI